MTSKKDKGSYNISPGAWARATYDAIKAEEAAKELEKSREQTRSNNEKWCKGHTPQLIRKGVYDITGCFHPTKILNYFPGIHGGAQMYCAALNKNRSEIHQIPVPEILEYVNPAPEKLERFQQVITQHKGGELLFPSTASSDTAKLKTIADEIINDFKNKHPEFSSAGGKPGYSYFSGSFTFEDVSFGQYSPSVSIWGVSNEAAEAIGAVIGKRLSYPFVVYAPKGNKTIEVRLIKVGEVDFDSYQPN